MDRKRRIIFKIALVKRMEDKDKIIALQRKKIEEMNKEIGVLKLEIALLKHEKKEQKKGEKRPAL